MATVPTAQTTTGNTDDQNLQDTTTSTSSATTKQAVASYIPNMLAAYSDYTYNVKLQVGYPINFNYMMAEQSYDPALWATIVQTPNAGAPRAAAPAVADANGQVHPSTATRTYFNKDLFLDDISIVNYVGLSKDTETGNITEIDFTITEPYGMSFLEELYDFCTQPEGLGESNYMQLPYLLVISFNGYLDSGVWQQIPNATKYIPISLAEMSVKLNAGGAVYTVKAYSYHELGNFEMYGRLKGQVEVTGKSINDLLTQFGQKINQDQQATTKANGYDYADTYKISVIQQNSQEVAAGTVDIGSVVMADPSDIVSKDTPMGAPATTSSNQINYNNLASNYLNYQISNQSQGLGAAITTANSTIRFNTGDAISTCINTILSTSKFATQQALDYQATFDKLNASLAATNSQATLSTSTNTNTTSQNNQTIQEQIASLQYPLQWFKVLSQVSIGPYDTKRNVYSRALNYTVKPYLVDNALSQNTPSQKPQLRVLKQYEYLYTGKNTEVINFDINLTMGFMVLAQLNANLKGLATGDTNPAPNPNKAQVKIVPKQDYLNQAKSIYAVPYSPATAKGTGVTTVGRSYTSDIASSLYAHGDLLTINITIFGDPDLIKQDEVFLYPPPSSLNPYIEATSSKPGGIAFDSGEIYFNLVFKTPVDYDLNTGLMDFASQTSATQQKRTTFSGLYKILSVTNKLSNGEFTQELSCVRYVENDSMIDATPNISQASTVNTTQANNIAGN